MDPNQPNNDGGQPRAGKKKQKKNRNQSGGKNANNTVEQCQSNSQGQQKPQQEQPKSSKDNIPQMPQNIVLSNVPNTKQQTQKKQKSKEANPVKASENAQKIKDRNQSGGKNANNTVEQCQSNSQGQQKPQQEQPKSSKDNIPQMPQNIVLSNVPNTKQQTQKKQKSKEANPVKASENAQKIKDRNQSGGKNANNTVEQCQSNSQGQQKPQQEQPKSSKDNIPQMPQNIVLSNVPNTKQQTQKKQKSKEANPVKASENAQKIKDRNQSGGKNANNTVEQCQSNSQGQQKPQQEQPKSSKDNIPQMPQNIVLSNVPNTKQQTQKKQKSKEANPVKASENAQKIKDRNQSGGKNANNTVEQCQSNSQGQQKPQQEQPKSSKDNIPQMPQNIVLSNVPNTKQQTQKKQKSKEANPVKASENAQKIKDRNQSGGKNANNTVEQCQSNSQGQQKPQQEQPKSSKDNIPQMPQNIVLSNVPNTKQQTQKKQKSKEANPVKASENAQKIKDRNQSGGKNANNTVEQCQSNSQGQQKPQQEQPKSSKDNIPQMPQNIVLSNVPNTKQQTQKKQKSKEANPVKASENAQKIKDDNQKNQQTQKENKPKETKRAKASEDPQKSKGVTPPVKPPPVSSSTNDQQIHQKIEMLKNKLAIPKRRNPKSSGSLGRKTEIEVNHLPLNLEKLIKKIVYHVDVVFNPELPKRLLRSVLEEFNRKHYPNVNFAFDGRRNMYTTKQLNGKCDTITVLNDENNKTIDFNVTTSVVNTIHMNKIEEYLKNGSSNATPGEAFQALDIVLKNRPFSLRFTNIGRSFYPVPRITPVDLGEGMELWKGFFQSPVMGWKPFLNLDVSHRGFPKHQPLTEYITNEMRCDLKSEMDIRSINSLGTYIKGLKVDFMIPNQPNTKRSYKVVGLLDTAAKFTFEMDKRNITVLQYYKIARNYTIKYPHLPCLHVGKIAKKTAIPIELCVVQKGQLRLKKLSENQTAVMVKNAARPPAERRHTIENCIKDIRYNQDPVLKDFGIEVKEQFASIPARVLDQPSLAYAQNREIKPISGVWKPDKFSSAVQINKWVVLNFDQRTHIQSIKGFEKILIDSGKELNVVIGPMNPVISDSFPRNVRPNDINRRIASFFEQQKKLVDLIVVIIPDFPPGIYAAVKQESELKIGVLTQCIRSRTMFKMNKSTACNILLKLNSKLNGTNHTLAVKSSPPSMESAIIFGADVTHPSQDQINIPSVAAVTASHDLFGSQYNMEWRLQSPKVEIIQDLEDIVHKQLLKYRARTKVVPKKIFYFRDGVSEGQFLQLLEHELIAIRRACLRLNIHFTPPITFVVVQKRHHTRMFPKHNIDMDGKFCNVPSGTIIDTQITHPTELDFYLCSHASIQGTSRPTKYHLIWDDNNLTEDQLEQLTFYLCFMFVRCTRSVSYPAPTYYAHLAAFRARAYIENKFINLNDLDAEQSRNTLNEAFTNNTPMFFI